MGLHQLTSVLRTAVEEVQPLVVRGRVLEVTGTIIKAVAPQAKVGELCILQNPGEDSELPAEVVGFAKNATLLTPLGEMYGVSNITEVIPTGRMHEIPVGPQLLGRVLDGMGKPMDAAQMGPLVGEKTYPVYADAPDPLTRGVIHKPLSLGLRVFDTLLTCGEGQRVGIFAAAGVGKSTLMGQLVKGADVDVIVIALIGERGREVREFIEKELGEHGMKKSVLVIATSNKSSMERSKAAYVATAIAEYFRDEGKKVLLMMDSLTRFARAQREIGLAAGEAPTRKGYPPSFFTALPKLVERPGLATGKGSITALYTVLVEGDDMNEPVADETRGLIDGHVIMSRALAAATHYPAVDALQSLSRVMGAVVTKEHKKAASRCRELMAKYKEIEMLVKIGEYKKGSDKLGDEAIAKIDEINKMLKQGLEEKTSFDDAVAMLRKITGV
ncbi:MAG: type III secretion system ATPase SctN [Candidatus Competibacterales bacterium]